MPTNAFFAAVYRYFADTERNRVLALVVALASLVVGAIALLPKAPQDTAAAASASGVRAGGVPASAVVLAPEPPSIVQISTGAGAINAAGGQVTVYPVPAAASSRAGSAEGR